MKFHPSNLFKVTLLNFGLLLSLSCQKDSDMLAEYVVENPKNILLNDIVIATLANQAIIIEPIDEETYKEPEKVIITEVTPPTIGSVEIKEGNTIIYTPEPEETGTDEFDYTTTVTNPDKTISTQTGKVSVTVTKKEDALKLNADVAYWKNAFDKQWISNDNSHATLLSKSANKNQEYYYLSYYIDGLTSMWRATGDNVYLDHALTLINNTVKDAVKVKGGYLGWPSQDGVQYSLWDGFYWRNVMTLLRVMHNSPKLRAIAKYRKSYEELLAFSEKNIWDRYEASGVGNFYRINTHMSSHWARIGMELYVITGKQKYKQVFDNISFGTMKGRPSNLRNQIYNNPKNSEAYTWSSTWGASKGSKVQDCSHAGAIVSFMVNAYENDMYWNKADMDALVITLDEVIFPAGTSTARKNVDGSGGNDIAGRIHEWLHLGRFNQKIQNKIKSNYTGRNLKYYGIQPLGIAALNAKILIDGKGFYPEN